MTNIPGAQVFVVGEPFHNARIRTLEDTLSEGNIVIVHGEMSTGSGSSRVDTHYQKIIGNTTATGFQRREIFVNSGRIEELSKMDTDGEEALKEAASDPSVEIDLIDQSAYGKDFTLGDVLSVDCGIWGAYALEVSEVTTNYSGDARTIGLTLGNARKDIMRVIRDSVTRNPSYRW